MANSSGLSKRAALRQQQELEERRKRTNRIVGIGLGIVALAVVAILAVVILQSLAKGGGAAAPGQTADQQTPPNATADFGVTITSKGTQPAADAPHLVVYEDFQCPACANMYAGYGAALYQLVDEGKITLEYRMATFLEDRLGNTSSTDASLAAMAADAVGKFREYHGVVYTNQPQEGVGYTAQQLRVDFPAKAGITGADLTKFQELYDTRAFADFVRNAAEQFTKNKIGGTPTYVVGDKQLQFYDQATQTVLIQNTADDLLRAIKEANS